MDINVHDELKDMYGKPVTVQKILGDTVFVKGKDGNVCSYKMVELLKFQKMFPKIEPLHVNEMMNDPTVLLMVIKKVNEIIKYLNEGQDNG